MADEPYAVAARDAHADGDPVVIAALTLGWEMSDLYAQREFDGPELEPPEALPGFEQLGPQHQVRAALARIRALLVPALGDASKQIVVPSVWIIGELPDGDPPAWGQALFDLHLQLTSALRAAGDAPLHAYDVGRSLAQICQDPEDLSELVDRLEPSNVIPIQGRLADLATRLPPHSAAAVSATLEQWRRWTIDARARESMSDIRAALARQGELWRALLSGDKDGRQMVDPDIAVAASVRHATHLGTLMRGMAGAYLPAIGLASIATLLLVYAILFQTGIATVIGALGAIAATLLVLRKVLSLTVSDTIDELRLDLWSAELDGAIAQSILRLPPSAPPAPRPRLTLAKPAETQVQKVQEGITKRVERALRVTRSAKEQGFRVPASGPAASQPDDDEPNGSAANAKPGA